MPKPLKISVALAALAALGGSALAQTPPPPPPVPAHHSLLHNLLHHNKPTPGQPMPGHMMPGHPMMGHTMMGHTSAMSGGVIGNKISHVYHLPGDKGALPSPQNRVYFHSAREAEAHGYHRAGGMSHKTMPMMHGSPMHGTMMHSSPMHPMPGTTH